jgi:hypothetical protein
MSRKKAVLLFDPERRPEQLAYTSERAHVLYASGDHLWVTIEEEQAPRFTQQGIAVEFFDEADTIIVPATIFDPVALEPLPPEALTAPTPTGGEEAYYLVQFIGAWLPEWIGSITERGGTFIQDVPTFVGVFRLTAGLAADIRAFEYVRWVGPYHPAYALSYFLAGRNTPFPPASLSQITVDPESIPTGDNGNIQVTFFTDIDIGTVAESGVRIIGPTIRGLIVQADGPESILQILRRPGVYAIEPFHEPEPEMNNAGVITNLSQVRDVGRTDFFLNLDGTGEIVGVIDTGLDTGTPAAIHNDVLGRVLQVVNLVGGAAVPDTGGHGTHVTGIIAANGARSNGSIRGVAPACRVILHQPLGFASVQGIVNAHIAGARVHNNSWGTPVAALGGVSNNAYTAGTTANLDLLGFTYVDSLIVFAAGNDERDIQPLPTGDGVLDMNRLRPEKPAKNAFVVGATENLRNNNGLPNSYNSTLVPPGRYPNAAQPLNAMANGAVGAFSFSDNENEMALFSSRGLVAMAANGRIRPDIAAPGTNIVSLRSSALVPSPPPAIRVPAFLGAPAQNFYYIDSGTSMATPHVSGAAILTRQFYRTRFGQAPPPAPLEVVPFPAAPPLPVFVDRPAASPHADGIVFGWISPAAPAAQKNLVAARYSRDVVPRDAAPIHLKDDVGAQPAPMLALHHDGTLLVHRDKTGNVQLSRFARDLTVHPFFNTATLTPPAPLDATRPPSLLVQGDQAAVAWADAGTSTLNFQRFDAETGAALDPAPRNLGHVTQASPHRYIAHDGTRYALVWVDQAGGNFHLLLRFVDAAGNPVGSAPIDLRTQAQAIKDPHIAWNPAPDPARFVITWIDSRTRADSELRLRFLDTNGAAIGADVVVRSLPAPSVSSLRRPCILPRAGGYILAWEDDTQRRVFDVYTAFLDAAGALDATIPAARRVQSVSDIPSATSGMSAFADDRGIVFAWQAQDATNADRLSVLARGMTLQGGFEAQIDANTPLIESGRYIAHRLFNDFEAPPVSMLWAGGVYFFLHSGGGGPASSLQMMRATADGVPDTAFGVNGVREVLPALGLGLDAYELHWTDTDNRVLCVATASTGGGRTIRVGLCDAAGNAVAAFGKAGVADIVDARDTAPDVFPQIDHRMAPALNALVAYGINSAAGGTRDLRYAVLNAAGGTVVAPVTLATASGTARHGWFHHLASEGWSIAAWHQAAGGTTDIFVSRFQPNGTPVAPAPPAVTAGLGGESIDACLAPRPSQATPAQREYGIVWQHRDDPALPWRVLFSRLDRTGAVINTSPTAPAVDTHNVLLVAPSAGADKDAIHPQIVSTFVHEPPNVPPPVPLPFANPVPGYGVAWLEFNAAGNRVLKFQALDENGRPAALAQPPGAPTITAPVTQVSADNVDVEDYKLIWNGRTFRLTWTERDPSPANRQMQTALTRHGSQIVFDAPSAALLRATIINGATNIDNTSLPNLRTPPGPGGVRPPSGVGGYGWGRLNLRQALAPLPPVAFHVRDDNAIGPNRTFAYRFSVPPGTALLRVTLTWNDLPGVNLVNRLHLKVRQPAQEYYGNTWQAPPNDWQSQPFAPGAPPVLQSIHNVEQVVLQNPVSGVYTVEVTSVTVTTNNLLQLPAQPFALVFVGSGREIRFTRPLPVPLPFY